MKVDLNIYNRILYGNLRPWDNGNKSEEKFRKKLTPGFKAITTNITSFEKALAAALKDYPATVEEEDYIFEIEEDNKKFQSVPDEIFEPLIDIQLPEPPNPKAEFYFILIRLEGIWLMNNLNKALQITHSENAKKYTLTKAIDSINSILRDSERVKKQLHNTQPKAQAQTNDYILLTLKYTLIRLQLEINELFESLLPARAFNERGIFESILKETPPPQSIIKDKAGLNSFRVRHYFITGKYNKQKTLDLISEAIETISNYFSSANLTREEENRQAVLLLNILALENLYFANEFGYDKLTHDFNTIISEGYTERIYSVAAKDINDKIEEQNLPNKRLTIIQKEEQRLSFLQAKIQSGANVYLPSIPRKLSGELATAKAYAHANLGNDFSKLLDTKQQKIQTTLSVPQLAFLFKMLQDLNPKIFSVKSEAELHRLVSANFITKKSNEEGISTDKLRILFNQPDNKAADFWEKHLHTMLAQARKLK